jgi:hypothetical protein
MLEACERVRAETGYKFVDGIQLRKDARAKFGDLPNMSDARIKAVNARIHSA